MSDAKNAVISFSISDTEIAEIIEPIDAIARREERSRSRIIIRALRFFLIHHSIDETIPQSEPVEVSE